MADINVGPGTEVCISAALNADRVSSLMPGSDILNFFSVVHAVYKISTYVHDLNKYPILLCSE